MKKKIKKAFTLVELLVVIAILAILATVSIVGYNSFTKKAKVSNDTTLVAQLNTLLKADEMVNGKANTPTDALKITSEAGYDVEKLTPTTNDYEIIWNQAVNQFALLDEKDAVVYGEKNADEYKNWKFVDTYTTITDYSVYLKGTAFTGNLEVKAGIDVGNNTNITLVNYANSDSKDDVRIRTNSTATTLSINASQDTVKHYNIAGTVNVISVDKDNSYHEFGTSNTMIVKDGHVVIEKDASVSNIIIDKNANSNISLENHGNVDALAGSDNTISISGVSNDKMIQTNDSLSSNGGYIKLSSNQDINEQIKLLADTILDLNGYTLTININNGILVEKGKLSIIDSATNGKIEAEKYASIAVIANGGNAIAELNSGTIIRNQAAGATVRVGTNDFGSGIINKYSSTFIVNGGKITGTYGILIMGQNSKLYVNGGEIYSSEGFAVGGNGSVSYGGTYIQINGGKIVSSLTSGTDDCAIYLPQNGFTEINGGYIEGYDAINIKSGSLTINGGTFVAKGVMGESIETNNGSVSTGSALTISSSKSYAGNITIKINGGIYNSTYGYAVAEIIPELATGEIAAASTCVNFIQFNGGTFNHGTSAEKSIYIEYAYEKISWDGIDSNIIKLGK